MAAFDWCGSCRLTLTPFLAHFSLFYLFFLFPFSFSPLIFFFSPPFLFPPPLLLIHPPPPGPFPPPTPASLLPASSILPAGIPRPRELPPPHRPFLRRRRSASPPPRRGPLPSTRRRPCPRRPPRLRHRRSSLRCRELPHPAPQAPSFPRAMPPAAPLCIAPQPAPPARVPAGRLGSSAVASSLRWPPTACPPGGRAGKSLLEPHGAGRSHDFLAPRRPKCSSDRDLRGSGAGAEGEAPVWQGSGRSWCWSRSWSPTKQGLSQ